MDSPPVVTYSAGRRSRVTVGDGEVAGSSLAVRRKLCVAQWSERLNARLHLLSALYMAVLSKSKRCGPMYVDYRVVGSSPTHLLPNWHEAVVQLADTV